jgi:hypothetical protein
MQLWLRRDPQCMRGQRLAEPCHDRAVVVPLLVEIQVVDEPLVNLFPGRWQGHAWVNGEQLAQHRRHQRYRRQFRHVDPPRLRHEVGSCLGRVRDAQHSEPTFSEALKLLGGERLELIGVVCPASPARPLTSREFPCRDDKPVRASGQRAQFGDNRLPDGCIRHLIQAID